MASSKGVESAGDEIKSQVGKVASAGESIFSNIDKLTQAVGKFSKNGAPDAEE